MVLLLWTVLGAAAQILFVVTVYHLYFFLLGVDAPAPPQAVRQAVKAALVDSLLALQFAASHSWLLHPTTRKRLARFVPQPAYGAMFCGCTCISLLLTISLWRPIGGSAWNLIGTNFALMRTAFYGAWVALFYSLYLSGIGYQTGWTTWWPWIRGREAPRRDFRPRSLYLLFRHPVYFSFLGLIWFVPVMTTDRAVLTFWWTIYIFVGSWLKDRRLVHYIGDAYRRYQSRVPGYPGMRIGPLGRIAQAVADGRVPQT